MRRVLVGAPLRVANPGAFRLRAAVRGSRSCSSKPTPSSANAGAAAAPHVTVAKEASKQAQASQQPNKFVGYALMAGTAAVFAGGLNFMLEFPQPCQLVWEETLANAKVEEEFGDNLTKSWFWDGSVTSNMASVTLFISGSKGSGSVYGRLVKTPEGSWQPVLIAARSGEKLLLVKEKRFV